MRRNVLVAGLALTVLVSVFLALGNRTATTAWADPSGMDWDVSMDDPDHTAPTQCTTNNSNGSIDADECPDVEYNFWIQKEGGLGGTQSLFDQANVIWTTGPLGEEDHTGDEIPDPDEGLLPNRPTTLGATVGMINLEIQSNLLVGALLQNNVDDVIAENDSHVTGQPISCGADVDGDDYVDTLLLADAFELWNAVTDDSNGIVPASEAQLPDDYPEGCESMPDVACAPKGVRMLPAPIVALEEAIGAPPGSAVSRAYGIARLPIVAGITSDLDVNFLVYSLHGLGFNGYLSVTLIQYPNLPWPDPATSGYNPLAQTVQTCPPYSTTATIYGVTADPDFDKDGLPDLSVTPELNRLVRCDGGSCGPYDYAVQASMAADYDGDDIPCYADRCDIDPATGSAAGDSDGDALTGGCEANGEGINPKDGGWNAAPPWDTGQDVDDDGYMNYVDNCPTVADADLDEDGAIDYQRDSDGDGVGDVCDPAPQVPGDGRGYPDPSPGTFVDYDDMCRDPWSVGASEGTGDEGRVCLKRDAVLTDWEDSNDDGTPDYLDLTTLGSIVMADCDSDSDSDGLVDAVEAAPRDVRPCAPDIMRYGLESDPLDARSPGEGYAVGGLAEPSLLQPEAAASDSASSTHSIVALAAAAAASVVLLAAGARYVKRRRLD